MGRETAHLDEVFADEHSIDEERDYLIRGDTEADAIASLVVYLDHRGLDVVDVLLALASERSLSTADVERALSREAKLKRSTAGGRPSKVDRLGDEIVATIDNFDAAERDRRVSQTLDEADISRSTFYAVRERVLDEREINISRIISPSTATE